MNILLWHLCTRFCVVVCCQEIPLWMESRTVMVGVGGKRMKQRDLLTQFILWEVGWGWEGLRILLWSHGKPRVYEARAGAVPPPTHTCIVMSGLAAVCSAGNSQGSWYFPWKSGTFSPVSCWGTKLVKHIEKCEPHHLSRGEEYCQQEAGWPGERGGQEDEGQ